MVARETVVRTKRRIYCDCCGVWLRGRKERSKKVQFELFYRPVGEGVEPISFRFRDLCKLCHEVLAKIPVRVTRRFGQRSKDDPPHRKVKMRRMRKAADGEPATSTAERADRSAVRLMWTNTRAGRAKEQSED